VLDYVTDGLGVGIGVNQGDVGTYADAISAAGFRWVRSRVYWGHIETSRGQYNWKAAPNYDRIVDTFNAQSIGVMHMLQMTGNGAHGSGASPPYDAVGRAAFAAFAASGVSRYKGKKVMWELGNEPNISNFWPMKNTLEGALAAADEYSALAHVVIPAMRAADPNCFITGPGLAGTGVNLSVAQAYLSRLKDLGVLDLFDRVSVHFYTAEHGNLPTDNLPAGRAPEDAHYDSYFGLVGAPVLNTEHGWRTDGSAEQDRLQASYHVRDFLFGLSRGVRFRSAYLWANTTKQDQWFLKDRDAQKAFGVLSRELAGFRYARRIDTGHPQQYVFEYANAEGSLKLAAWKRDSGVPSIVSLAHTGPASYVDVVSGVVTPAPGLGHGLALSVHPVYVRLS
jgi:hypothetical protein